MSPISTTDPKKTRRGVFETFAASTLTKKNAAISPKATNKKNSHFERP